MISDKDLPELKDYRRLEGTLPIKTNLQFGPLVVGIGNEPCPVHRWFRYKEAYSPKLLEAILLYAAIDPRKPLVLLDPYSGVGTSLLSAQVMRDRIESAIGIERNPLIAFVARTKLAWPEIDTQKLERMAISVLSNRSAGFLRLPELSSIRTGKCISKHISLRLLSIRDSICEFPPSPTRDALLLGLAASIEPLSRIRKDGRALRIVDRSYQHTVPTLMDKWIEMQHDIGRMKALYKRVARASIKEGDGRNLQAEGIEANSIDIVLTSPPYPNNIDYSEVYKLELWLLGFISSAKEFLGLRKLTLRSHPLSDLKAELAAGFKDAIAKCPLNQFFDPLLSRTNAYDEKWRNRLALGYFSDLWTSLNQQYHCLRPGGRIFLVIGNSLHGRAGKAYLIPTDLLVAQLAKNLGFELEEILITRNTLRRLSGNHFLRESIVALRKPKND